MLIYFLFLHVTSIVIIVYLHGKSYNYSVFNIIHNILSWFNGFKTKIASRQPYKYNNNYKYVI